MLGVRRRLFMILMQQNDEAWDDQMNIPVLSLINFWRFILFEYKFFSPTSLLTVEILSEVRSAFFVQTELRGYLEISRMDHSLMFLFVVFKIEYSLPTIGDESDSESTKSTYSGLINPPEGRGWGFDFLTITEPDSTSENQPLWLR